MSFHQAGPFGPKKHLVNRAFILQQRAESVSQEGKIKATFSAL